MSTSEGQTRDSRRLFLLAAALILGFLVIIAQLVRYQVLMHAEMVEEANAEHVRVEEIHSTRGRIVDANGQILAMDLVQWTVSADPPLVTNPDELADRLGSLLNEPRDELYELLTARRPWVLIARQVPQEVGEAIAGLEWSGLTCTPNYLRVYPAGGLVSHVIGIVNSTGDGFYGVEGYQNQTLKPVPGRRVILIDSAGQKIPGPPLEYEPPIPGTDLVLTLDLNIQYIVEEELKRALEEYGAESGSVVVMDPRTGGVLAVVSHPHYNPNSFADAELGLLADPSVSSMWEPGSIFKIVTWAAALDSGTVSGGTVFDDDGTLEVGGRTIWNSDRKGHGLVTVEDGLVHSLNTVAAFLSTSMGKERFYTYVRRFGFGALTGVDLSSEGPGLVKLPGDSNWFPSDLGTNAFGQGIAVTPMQMVSAASAVANRGLLMNPHIVQQTVSNVGGGEQRETVKVEPMVMRRAISQDAADTLSQMLVAVVDRHAEKAQVPGYSVAGKTGTAQIPTPYGYHPDDTIASFVGFAPADDPRFVILVKLDAPQTSPWGSQTAAPTFKAISERLFVYMQIPPDEIRVAQH